MRGKMLLASMVIALIAFSGVLFAMTSEEISKLPSEERMKYEQELRMLEHSGTVQAGGAISLPADRVMVSKSGEYFAPRLEKKAIIGTRSEAEKAVIIEEGFEGAWPPAGWTVVQTCTDVSGPTPGYWTQTDGTAGSPPIGVHSGLYNSGLWWSYDHQDEWLITDDITLTGSTSGTYYLTFWTYGWEGSIYDDHYYVKASTDGGTNWDVLLDLSDLTGNDWNAWDYSYVIDLSDYAGQTINLAWHAIDCDDPENPNYPGLWYVWFIDDVSVWYPLDHDVGVTAIYAPVGTYMPDISVTPSVEVENFGGNNETFDVTFNIYNGVRDLIYSETETDVTVNSGATQVVNFPAWTTVLGEYTTEAYTELTTDQEPLNDTLDGSFVVSEYIPPDTLLYDDGIYANGWAYYVGGNGWGGKFTPSAYPATIQGPTIYLYPSSWPSPGGDNYKFRLLDDDGAGGAPGTVLYESPVLTGIRGAWNYTDIVSENIVITDGNFYLFYIQEGDYPYCPGLAIDEAVNAPAGTWWEYLDGSYNPDTDVEGDWLMRCVVGYGPPPEHDVAAMSIIEPSGTYVSGTVVAPKTKIKNFGSNTETFDTYFNIYDGTKDEVYSEVINTTLAPGEMDTLVFPNFTIDEGSFEAVSYTDLEIDENPANDTAYSTFGAISFFECFESGEWPPYGWATYMTGDVATNHGWQSLYAGCPDSPNCLPYEGDYGAWHQDDMVNCEDWLVSPPLIVGPGASLSFYHNEYFYSYYEYHGVWVSTGSPDPADGDYVEVEEVPPIPSPYGWQPYGPIDLSEFVEDGIIYVAFKYTGYFADHWYLDCITGTDLTMWHPDHDVGVTEITEPQEMVVAGDTIYPEVEVKNFGLNSETFDVTVDIYSLDKQEYTSTVTEVYLDPGLTLAVEFEDAWIPSGGTYEVVAYTQLDGDEDPINDTLEMTVNAIGWLEDFEATDGDFEPTPPTGGWEWGVPTSGPGSAYSGVNCWATNLDGNYENYADWRLERDFIATSDNPVLTFYHWYYTESYYDGGNVKISTDFGNTWQVIYPDGGYPEDAAYSGNSGIPGEPCYSADGQSWRVATFPLSTYVGEGDVFTIRWHFGTDFSVNSYPGWYVDDVMGVGLEAFVPAHDVGIAEIVSPTGVVLEDGAITPEVVVENLGPLADTVDVTLVIDPTFECGGERQPVYEEVLSVIVDAETTLAVFFPAWDAGAGSYELTAFTYLPSDEFPGNDTSSVGCIVATWVEDFEDGVWPPLGWGSFELDEEAGWQQLTSGAYSGSYGAWHNDDYADCNDWLVTPKYQVGENAHLYFYQRNVYASYCEYHGLWTSDAEWVPDEDYNELEETYAAPSDWTIYGPVALCDYVGDQISIAFVYQGYFADEWYLDDVIGINLIPRIPYDVSVDLIPLGVCGEKTDTLPQGTLLHPAVVVANNSPEVGGPDLSFRVYYKIHKDGNIYWQRFYDVVNLPPSTVDTVWFSGDVVFNELGLYTITTAIQTAFVDPILENNAMTKDVYIGGGHKMAVNDLPKVFALHQNAPNPARSSTTIRYAIPKTTDVVIRVYDLSGRIVKTLVNEIKEPGYYTANWDMKNEKGLEIASGIYFYEINAGEFKSVRKMVVMK